MSKLKDGAIAPAFEAKSLHNEEINLSNLKGKKVMISFYRYASCPMCNLRVNELIGKYPEWAKQGLTMIAVFQSPDESLKKYVGKQDAPFPIIGDPKHKLYKVYGVEGNWGKLLMGTVVKPKTLLKAMTRFSPGKIETDITMVPADFLIDEHGVIRTAYYGKDASDHLSVDRIDSFLNN